MCIEATCKPPFKGGLCRKHLRRKERHGVLEGPQIRAYGTLTCDECDGKHYAKGKCEFHYGRVRKVRKILSATQKGGK